MNTQPVALNVAIAGLVSSAVTLAAIFWPERLDPGTQGVIVAFVNSVIVVATILLTMHQVTPIANPTLKAGTSVNVEHTSDSVIIAASPPGPTGVEGGSSEGAG